MHNEPAMPAGPCKCKGANCGATDGRHSRECIAEAGAAQGWAPTSADYADCGPSRVTPDDIQREIVGEHYFTAEQGARHPDAQNPLDFGDIPGNLGLLTFCVLRLRNGFTVTGESACASPENFDAAIGRCIARANAVQKIWPLLGFRLRDKLAASA
ncbi:Gp49 family protein [Delftia tsuruhatensis]|uniref:Gp49 family protein n=1 Tax=Delftia tsuruhatensis TaxID=180282 RepID=UPI0028B038E4|nr:Gp49 family protein [Delftia tsuruhatensis]